MIATHVPPVPADVVDTHTHPAPTMDDTLDPTVPTGALGHQEATPTPAVPALCAGKNKNLLFFVILFFLKEEVILKVQVAVSLSPST